ncbi:MAG TPA: DUF2934 domain-containing protein [Syntrophales bacterium]|nr:DUF2934 domain-containing protein [Syntrophales bacterium]HOX93318.1 DUF2934 domain-containing protein [Syntrophales bacterium]HPI56519.1 DUF2934 domain-containing protein [Syntrophales bacterium]HPN25060.1 DUF2934 domain-containing protein [Syntrophales bacterium]HQM29197.1 DUF2934 domain-containing protein [Syntrophales bacterium]
MNPDLHAQIAKVAYDLYQKEGRCEGREIIHWLQAEKIVTKGYPMGPTEPSPERPDAKRGPAKPAPAAGKARKRGTKKD